MLFLQNHKHLKLKQVVYGAMAIAAIPGPSAALRLSSFEYSFIQKKKMQAGVNIRFVNPLDGAELIPWRAYADGSAAAGYLKTTLNLQPPTSQFQMNNPPMVEFIVGGHVIDINSEEYSTGKHEISVVNIRPKSHYWDLLSGIMSKAYPSDDINKDDRVFFVEGPESGVDPPQPVRGHNFKPIPVNKEEMELLENLLDVENHHMSIALVVIFAVFGFLVSVIYMIGAQAFGVSISSPPVVSLGKRSPPSLFIETAVS